MPTAQSLPWCRVGGFLSLVRAMSPVYGLELAGEDDAFAVHEAAIAAVDPELVAPGLAVAPTIDQNRLRGLAFTRAACRLVGRCEADVPAARTVIETTDLVGEADGPHSHADTVAVRARDVRSTAGVSTAAVERQLGKALVDRGFQVDLETPDYELRALFAGDRCLLGWLVAESIRDFGQRRPTEKPFFQPGSMDPLEARACANLAGAAPGNRLLDPMCGTGGLLVEAGLVGSAVVGIDIQQKMVRGSRTNLRAYLGGSTRNDRPVCGEFSVANGDATNLPIRDESITGVVFDVPYGRQSKIARHPHGELIAGALTEAARVATRGVVVADESLCEPARDAGWTIERTFERPVHQSLTRYIHLLGQ